MFFTSSLITAEGKGTAVTSRPSRKKQHLQGSLSEPQVNAPLCSWSELDPPSKVNPVSENPKGRF